MLRRRARTPTLRARPGRLNQSPHRALATTTNICTQSRTITLALPFAQITRNPVLELGDMFFFYMLFWFDPLTKSRARMWHGASGSGSPKCLKVSSTPRAFGFFFVSSSLSVYFLSLLVLSCPGCPLEPNGCD